MDWRLIEYRKFPGKFNMEFDLNLVNTISDNTPTLRFYGWEPHCISLGANQSLADINTVKTDSDNIDIVKRPTGGRAILHSHELTYSVVLPNTKSVSGKKLYEDISNAIVQGLKLFDESLLDVSLESSEPHFPTILKEPTGSICFASSAKNEIKFKGKKLVGSAQRKLGSTILQHGSILIDNDHLKLVDYLNVNQSQVDDLKKEMTSKTTDIFSITNKYVDIYSLQSKIIEGFEEVLSANFLIDELHKI